MTIGVVVATSFVPTEPEFTDSTMITRSEAFAAASISAAAALWGIICHAVPHVDFQAVLEGDVVNARADQARAVLVPADHEDFLVPGGGLLRERQRRGQKDRDQRQQRSADTLFSSSPPSPENSANRGISRPPETSSKGKTQPIDVIGSYASPLTRA